MLRLAAVALAASALSCATVRVDADERSVVVGEEYHAARDRLVASGAIEITNLVRFYGGQSPYSLVKTKDGALVMSSHLLVYQGAPADEIQGWFLLPDRTCVSLFVRGGDAARIARIELGEAGAGFRPPAEALRPEAFSPALADEQDGEAVTIEHEEKPRGTSFWSGQVRTTIGRLPLGEPARESTLSVGMPLRRAAEFLAAHAAEDLTGGVAVVDTVSHVPGTYPRTLPADRLYILPGNTLLIVGGRFDPLAVEQFTVDALTLGEPGVGYPAGPGSFDQEFTRPDRLSLTEAVRRAGVLHLAARTGDVDALRQALREHPEAINALDGEGSTPLHWAVRRGKREAANALITAGADVQAADPKGNTPLILAAGLGRRDLVDLLLRHGAHPQAANQGRVTAFLAAGRRGDLATVELLLKEHGADPNQADENDFTLLHRAAGRANLELTRLLLQHGAEPNVYRSGISPLYEAISDGSVDVVRLLLNAGAKIEPPVAGEWRPLDALTLSGSVEIARMLLARGMKPDGSALFGAAAAGHGPLVKLFLDQGADLNHRAGFSKQSVLHSAGSAEVVRILVKAGLSIELKDDDGRTPLHLAARFEPHEVVVALLELGADARAVDNFQQTPLHQAVERDPDRGEKEVILKTLRALRR